MKRPRSAAPLAGLAATALLAGCASLTSPATIIKPYDAADGTTVRISASSLTLANFLVVGAAQGQPAAVSGSVINAGASPVTVTLGAASDQTEVTVGGNSAVQVGPDKVNSLTLSSLSVLPGARIQMSASTPVAGSTAFSVPVLRPVGYYAGLTPSPTPAPTPTASTHRARSATATPTPTSLRDPGNPGGPIDAESPEGQEVRWAGSRTPSNL